MPPPVSPIHLVPAPLHDPPSETFPPPIPSCPRSVRAPACSLDACPPDLLPLPSHPARSRSKPEVDPSRPRLVAQLKVPYSVSALRACHVDRPADVFDDALFGDDGVDELGGGDVEGGAGERTGWSARGIRQQHSEERAGQKDGLVALGMIERADAVWRDLDRGEADVCRVDRLALAVDREELAGERAELGRRTLLDRDAA